MDPICHTLVGGSLAGTRLGERSWGAAATLIVAANLPDIDVLAYARGGDFALSFRRGWTHGLPAQLVLPLLLAATVIACGRARGVSGLRPRQIVLLSYLGLLTHPALDWLNTYGMRWLMPFDGRWFYGDTLFIVDPWLWLLLGSAAFLRFSPHRRSLVRWAAAGLLPMAAVLLPPQTPLAAKGVWLLVSTGVIALRLWRGPISKHHGQRLATAALIASGLFVGSMMTLASGVHQATRAALARTGEATPREIYVGPLPSDPTRWDVLLVHPDRYRPATYTVVGANGLALRDQPLAIGADDPWVQRALAAPCAQGMRTWMRYPFYRVEPEGEGGSAVHILDARYKRSPSPGFGGAVVRLDAAGEVLGCR